MKGMYRQLRIAGLVSLVYVWAYYTTMYFVPPLQEVLLPGTVMSLLFLPHGVRVLSAWLYGWRSVLYLLPGALLCNQHFAGARAWDAEILAGTMVSLIAAPLAITVLRRVLGEAAISVGAARVGGILIAGAAATTLNMTGLWLAYGLDPHEVVVTLLGDMGGLLAALLILRGAFWLAER